MKKNLASAILVVALLVLSCASKPASTSAIEPPSFSPEALVETRLENGLRIGALRHQRIPGEAAVALAIKVGSFAEETGQKGYAHLVEHIAFEAIDGRSGKDFREELRRRDPRTAANGWTSYYTTIYVLPVRLSEEGSLDFALDAAAGFLETRGLDQETLDRARAVVLREMAEDEDSGYDKEGLPEEEAAEVLGLRRNLEEASLETVAAFRTRWYRSDLAAVYFVGDIDARTGLDELRKRFSALAPSPGEPPAERLALRKGLSPRKQSGNEGKPSAYLERERDGGTLVQLAFPLDADRNRDVRARAVEALAVRLLETRLDGRLGWSSASSWRPTAWSGTRNFVIEAHAAPEATVELVRGLGDELRLVVKKGFSPQELATARAGVLETLQRTETARSRYSPLALARELGNRFGYENTPFANLDVPSLAAAIEEPGTLAEAEKFLGDHLSLDELDFDVYGLPRSAEELRVAWKSARARPVATLPRGKLPVLPAPVPPVDRFDDERSGVRLLVYGNGARVALLPARSGEDLVQIWGLSPGGYLGRPEERVPAYRLSDEVPAFAGTALLPGRSFARELGARGAGLWFSLEPRHEEIGGSTPAGEFEAFLRILDTALGAAAAMDDVSYAGLAAAVNDDPEYYDLLLGRASADRYGDGAAFQALSGRSIAGVEAASLPRLFEERFGDPGDFLWCLSGLPDLDAAEALVSSAIGSLSREGRGRPETFPAPPPALRSGLVDRSQDDLYTDRSSVDVRAELPLSADDASFEGLGLRTLAEAFYAELFTALRGEELSIYSLDVRLRDPSIATGGNALKIAFSCAESAAPRLVEVLRKRSAALAAGEISEASLESAIDTERRIFENAADIVFEPWIEALAATPVLPLEKASSALDAAYRGLSAQGLRDLARRLVRSDELFIRVTK